ncbi:hypothetical protein RclHR1_00130039 [Rhizophagus clarus]|uniref:Uncharacterized protein n=1 Tax=Rhizophagus clarus TaxID=94130 RepID=A0A2Z6R179_9GLOM|nr:hypothetical protein RclHR1_00130039 [Rhizophagus clarus]
MLILYSCLPKYTYKKRDPRISNKAANKQLRFNDEKDTQITPFFSILSDKQKELKNDDDTSSTTNKNTVTLSDSQEKQNQGVISSFVIGHIISENELALESPYSPYRELNDVFDEFLELQRQSNKIFGKSSIKKTEKNSDVKKNSLNRNVKNNNGRENKKKLGSSIGGNGERNQTEIAKRALKSKPTNVEKSERTPADKNRIQRNVLKNNEEFYNKIDTKIEKRRIDIDNQYDIKYNNDEIEDWHNMYPILTSTPNSSINFEANIITEFHNSSNEEDDIGDILPDSFSKNGGQNPPKENLSTFNEVDSKEKKETWYSSQDTTNMELSYPEKDEIRRFVFKQLSNDDDELEGFYDFKSGNNKKD